MTSKYDFIETPEQEAARHRVRAFHFGKYREAAPAPVKSEGPGSYVTEVLSVEPAPASKAPRYVAPDELHKCLTCPTLIGPTRKHCEPCVTIRKRRRGDFLTAKQAEPCIGFVDEGVQHDCGKPVNRLKSNATRCAVCRTRARISGQRARRAAALAPVASEQAAEVVA